MKILLHYLKPYKILVILVLVLAGINIGFSLIDPIILGKLINLASHHQQLKKADGHGMDWNKFFWAKETIFEGNKKFVLYGVIWLLLGSISVAMVSRIAKAFQDYTQNLITQ